VVALDLLESIPSLFDVIRSFYCNEDDAVSTVLDCCLDGFQVSLIEKFFASKLFPVVNSLEVNWLLRSDLFANGYSDDTNSNLIRFLRILGFLRRFVFERMNYMVATYLHRPSVLQSLTLR